MLMIFQIPFKFPTKGKTNQEYEYLVFQTIGLVSLNILNKIVIKLRVKNLVMHLKPNSNLPCLPDNWSKFRTLDLICNHVYDDREF